MISSTPFHYSPEGGIDAVIAEKQPVITWTWVRGHAGDPFNERVHKLVMQAREA